MDAMLRNVKLRKHPRHKCTQGAMAEHYALGSPGGAGGVHHIGLTLRRGAIDGDRSRVLRKGLGRLLFRQDCLRCRILHHVSLALLGVCRVYGHIGRPDLMHGDDSGQKFLHPAHFEGNKIACRYAFFQQPGSNAVGCMLQLPVGEGSLSVHHGNFPRSILCVFQEEVHPSFGGIVFQRLSPGQSDALPHLIFSRQGNIPQGSGRAVKHLPQYGFHRSGKCPHPFLIVDGIGRSGADFVIRAGHIDDEFHIHLACGSWNHRGGIFSVAKIHDHLHRVEVKGSAGL